MTFELCKTAVDDYLLVSEDEIKQAMCSMLEKEHCLMEGAAAVACAGLFKNKHNVSNKTIVIIICGANISLRNLRQVICEI